MFKKILIANRGEIAVRIIRACQEMGIATVAVYSEADASALHTWLADESVLIGASPPGDSYLRADRIIAAAQQLNCDAIHPGYGFLAENAAFAAAVAQAGLTFIGPSAEAIRLMGAKTTARATMQAAGLPVVPGYQGSNLDADLLTAAANGEQQSNHPLAKSIVQTARTARITLDGSNTFEEVHGRGVKAATSLGMIHVGRPTWLVELFPDIKSEIEAVSGLAEGDLVVVNPSDDVKNGVVVKAIARK